MAEHSARSYPFHVFLTFLLALLLLSSPPVQAQQEPAGRVTVVLGTVEAEDADGERRRLQRGDSVYQGDTLHAGPRGRAQIRFTDRGMLSLRPDTALSIDSYASDDADPAANRQEMSLQRGGFRAQTGRIASANRQGYRVQTPMAAIGIRGTVFDAHQHDGGALLVGSTEGGVEVETTAGVVGRIGAGENFNYLRVNPDGSIDFLLETPEEFTLSPELDEGDEEEALDVGDGGQASVATGAGASESTAGIEVGSGEESLDVSNDPERSGSISPSRRGSGEQPVASGQPVLDADQIAALLADDRIGVALGVPVVSEDEDGSPLPVAPALQGGIATFNSPLLALRSSRGGFGSGVTDTDRADLLAEADLLLRPDSAEFEAEQDVAGIDGLVWGRYLAPVTLFADPDDATRRLELERDVLFLLGTPVDVAVLEGQHAFSLEVFEAVSSGLPINDVFAQGVLDVGTGRYAGFLDILLGEDSATGASLFAEFGADVRGGVLEDLDFGTLDLFDFATETSSEAEGELAGFFTGEAAAFLQLAFDFRVTDRDDADVAGLALLARELTMDVLTPGQQAALVEDDAIAFALGVEPTGFTGAAAAPGISGGVSLGIATLFEGEPLLAMDSRAAAVAGVDRGEWLAGADALFTAGSGEFELDEDVEGSGVTWGVFSAPVLQFLDDGDADAQLELDRDVTFALGTPVDVANREGAMSYELVAGRLASRASSGGMEVLDLHAGAALDFDNAVLFGFLDVLYGSEEAEAELVADYRAAVEAGLLTDLEFLFLQFVDLMADETAGVQGEIAGFLAGNEGDFLQLMFDFRVDGRSEADVSGMALLAEVTDIAGGALSAEEFFELQEGLFFVAVNCCFEDDGFPTGTLAGRVTDPLPSAGEGAILGYGSDDGSPLPVTDARFGAALPDLVIRREDADVANFDGELDHGLAAFEWQGFEGAARAFDSVEGDEVRDFTQNLLVLTGRPSSLAELTGSGRYEVSTTVQGFFRHEGDFFDPTPLRAADMSFNVDFADGVVTDGVLRAFLEFFGEGGPSNGEGGQPGGEGGVVAAALMEAFFRGQILAEGEHAFVDFEVLDGGLQTEGTEPLDLERSFIDGFFTGEEAEAFATAFHLQTEGFGGSDDRTLLVGNAILERQDLSLSDAEAALFAETDRHFVAVTCCGDEADGFRGLASESGGDPVLGLQAGSEDPIVPAQLLRRAGADSFIAFGRDLAGSEGEAATEFISWFAPSVPLRVDADSGEILQRLDDVLLFQAALPADVATLEAMDFTTFSGSHGLETANHFGFGDGEFVSEGFNASFNVDLGSGEIFAGHLFVVEERVVDGSDLAELGFEVFFEGFLALDEGEVFADLTLLDGHYRQRTPLDLGNSRLDGFFADDGAEVTFAGSYALFGEDEGDMRGLFEIGHTNLPEERLSRDEVASWVRIGPDGERRPGMALAAFRVLGGQGNMFLLGRGGPVAEGEPFLLGANEVPSVRSPDHLFTGRDSADFFAQPFDLVLRQETAFGPLAQEISELFDPDARPPEAPSFEGFEVSWGAWSNSGADAPPQIQFDPSDPDASFSAGDETYFASINPTPTSQLPRTGQFSYGGEAAFIGGGRGALSQFSQARLDEFDVSFEMDFATGAISGGSIDLEYGSSGRVRWSGEFEGQLLGAVTDLQLTALTVAEESSGDFGPPMDADLGMSGIGGIFTGPEGERHAGGFNFFYDVPGEEFNNETVEGLWVIDRLGGD